MLYVPCAMHYALSTTSRGRAGGRGAFSPSLSPRRGHTKYRVRVRVRVELRRHLLGRSAGPRDEARVARRERERACRLAALPPCRLRSKRAVSSKWRETAAPFSTERRHSEATEATDGSAGEAAGHMHAATPLTSPTTTTIAAGRACALQVPGRLNTKLERAHLEHIPREGRAENERATASSYARLHPPNLQLCGCRRVWQGVGG